MCHENFFMHRNSSAVEILKRILPTCLRVRSTKTSMYISQITLYFKDEIPLIRNPTFKDWIYINMNNLQLDKSF